MKRPTLGNIRNLYTPKEKRDREFTLRSLLSLTQNPLRNQLKQTSNQFHIIQVFHPIASELKSHILFDIDFELPVLKEKQHRFIMGIDLPPKSLSCIYTLDAHSRLSKERSFRLEEIFGAHKSLFPRTLLKNDGLKEETSKLFAEKSHDHQIFTFPGNEHNQRSTTAPSFEENEMQSISLNEVAENENLENRQLEKTDSSFPDDSIQWLYEEVEKMNSGVWDSPFKSIEPKIKINEEYMNKLLLEFPAYPNDLQGESLSNGPNLEQSDEVSQDPLFSRTHLDLHFPENYSFPDKSRISNVSPMSFVPQVLQQTQQSHQDYFAIENILSQLRKELVPANRLKLLAAFAKNKTRMFDLKEMESLIDLFYTDSDKGKVLGILVESGKIAPPDDYLFSLSQETIAAYRLERKIFKMFVSDEKIIKILRKTKNLPSELSLFVQNRAIVASEKKDLCQS